MLPHVWREDIQANMCKQMGDSGPQPIGSGSDTMLNYHLSQKLKLIGRGKFNHLTITVVVIELKGRKNLAST
jgi:hypothetical protein